MCFKISHGKTTKRVEIGRTNLPRCLRLILPSGVRITFHSCQAETLEMFQLPPCIHYISALSYAGEHLSSVTIHLRCAFAFPRDNYSIVNISSLSEIYP